MLSKNASPLYFGEFLPNFVTVLCGSVYIVKSFPMFLPYMFSKLEDFTINFFFSSYSFVIEHQSRS